MKNDKLDDLEFRVFELEQQLENLTLKLSDVLDQIGFYYKVEENTIKDEQRENLLTIEETSQILDQSISTINQWVAKNKLTAIRIANKLYFNKDEVKKLFKKLMLNE